MGLQFPGEWRFSSPIDGTFINSSMPTDAVRDFIEIIDRIANQGDRWRLLEHFKSHFGNPSKSSSESWAQSDLRSAMDSAAKNAPMFIESFLSACQGLRTQEGGLYAPDASFLNKVLARHNVGYEVHPPNLVLRGHGIQPIAVEVVTPSLAVATKELIEESLKRSEQLLTEGQGREAVQEILWLLETVSTAFRGLETESGKVEGKYFNKIVGDLRIKRQGAVLQKVLDWCTSMHGYLSSPGGGGIRHGADLNANIRLEIHEARLFCNLTRSYISFLLTEHQALTEGSKPSRQG